MVLPVALLILAAPGPRKVGRVQVDEDRARNDATEIAKRVIDGVARGDFKRYSQDFSEEMRKAVDRESFLQLQSKIQKRLGKFESLEYLGYYVQYGQIITLLKARFQKDKDDVLIKLVLDPKKTQPTVTGLWLDAPSLEK
jgi:hypothetical protein